MAPYFSVDDMIGGFLIMKLAALLFASWCCRIGCSHPSPGRSQSVVARREGSATAGRAGHHLLVRFDDGVAGCSCRWGCGYGSGRLFGGCSAGDDLLDDAR